MSNILLSANNSNSRTCDVLFNKKILQSQSLSLWKEFSEVRATYHYTRHLKFSFNRLLVKVGRETQQKIDNF